MTKSLSASLPQTNDQESLCIPAWTNDQESLGIPAMDQWPSVSLHPCMDQWPRVSLHPCMDQWPRASLHPCPCKTNWQHNCLQTDLYAVPEGGLSCGHTWPGCCGPMNRRLCGWGLCDAAAGMDPHVLGHVRHRTALGCAACGCTSRCILQKNNNHRCSSWQSWHQHISYLCQVAVCLLLYVPAVYHHVLGMDLLNQVCVLPHCRSWQSNLLSHAITAHWHRANKS